MTLQVMTLGAGPDLALLHGWGFGRGVWREIADQLATHHRVHLVSLPGYDGSVADSHDFDGTVSALLETIPLGSTLCGWSLGGMLALAAAARHPRHFARLVLVGTTPKFVQATDWTPAQPDQNLRAFLRWVLQAPAATLTGFITLLNRSDARADHISHHLETLLSKELPTASVLEKGLHWLRHVDLRPLTGHATLPTLIVHGDQDPLIPLAAPLWLTAMLPRARLRLCADTAHAPFAADPGQFCALLSEFCSAPV